MDFSQPANVQTTLVVDSSSVCPPGNPDDINEAQALGLKIFSDGANGQLTVRTFDAGYSDVEAIGFWSVNVGPCPGIYWGDYADVSPYVVGFKAGPGVTNCKRFKREADALGHCRKHSKLALAEYSLTDTRKPSGVPLGYFPNAEPAPPLPEAVAPPAPAITLAPAVMPAPEPLPSRGARASSRGASAASFARFACSSCGPSFSAAPRGGSFSGSTQAPHSAH